MTKPLQEETLVKLPLSLEDVRVNARTLSSTNLGVCTSRGRSLHPAAAQPVMIKQRTHAATFKTRLGKIMHRLYNLEVDSETDKKLDVDLDVDLYQMENY